MAVPTWLFADKWGFALMRYEHATANWEFLSWVTKSIYIDNVSPGTYTYALWLVVGGNSHVTSVHIDGWSRIAALQAAR